MLTLKEMSMFFYLGKKRKEEKNNVISMKL